MAKLCFHRHRARLQSQRYRRTRGGRIGSKREDMSVIEGDGGVWGTYEAMDVGVLAVALGRVAGGDLV